MNKQYYPSEEPNIFTMWFLIIEEMMEFMAKLVTAGIYLFFLWITGVITLVSFVFSIQPKKIRVKEDWEY